MRLFFMSLTMVGCLVASAPSQSGDETKDDKAVTFPTPPAGYDRIRDDSGRGKLETVEYDSTTVGVKR